MLLTTVAVVLVTAASMWWHLRRGKRKAAGTDAGAGGAAARSCPRCGGVVAAGTGTCGACGAPLHAYELVAAPLAAEAGAGAAGNGSADGARLHALVRADTCVGCGACVTACPVPGAIRLEGKLALVDKGLCEGHGECVKACPVGGILLSSGAAVQRVEAPDLTLDFESRDVPGLFVVGELGGRGLIKNAINEGKLAVEHVARELTRAARGPGVGAPVPAGDDVYDLVVVGSGPAGLSAGLEARRSNLRCVVLEQGDLSDTIHRYPRHKLLLAEPVRMPLYGDLWVADASKEALLKVWRTVIASTGLDVRTGQRVTDVRRRAAHFEVVTEGAVWRSRCVVLAMGRRGTPRRLEVPGEELPKVFYDIVEMEVFVESRMLVVGGGDSAVESAVGLASQKGTEVTLSYRGDDFTRVKERNQAKLAAEEERGRVRVVRRSRVREIRAADVVLDVDGRPRELANDYVVVRAGGDPPFAFLERVGVRIVTKEIALTVALLLALVPARAPAQVSPGPLSRAHADLDATTQCFKCHARGGGMDARCLDCHTEIAARRRAAAGIHGREARDQDCARCHPEHAGRDFALIQWDEGAAERFDHRRAGYALTGKHAPLACRECHQAKHQRAAAAGRVRIKNPARSWLGLETECAACHADPHKGGFGAECAKCHVTADWRRVDQQGFDHDRTRYPLRGKHAAVACERCHDPKTAWGKKPVFARCASCHKDAHAGQGALAGKPADCAACHAVEGFRPSTFGVADHRRTPYPLEGQHAAVACAACHKPRAGAPGATGAAAGSATAAAGAGLGSAGVRLRPPHGRCATCHTDAHGGQLVRRPDGGACGSCHSAQGFAPSTFAAAQHDSTRLPLAGRHAEVACAACHAAKRAGLPAPAGAASAGRAGFVFALGETRCEQCHRDPHRGRYAERGARPAPDGCAGCHDVRRFRPSRVDLALHRDLGYALEGAHRAVPCADCHREMAGAAGRAAAPGASLLLATAGAAAGGADLPFDSPRRDCAACHERHSPHGGQFAARPGGGACDACHGVEAFRPAGRFDHNRDTAFKLGGKHAGVPCARCHPERKIDGKPRVIYRGIPTRCEGCHDRGGKMLEGKPLGARSGDRPPAGGPTPPEVRHA
jgi:thioredoxin reductase/ferredoxin